MPSHLLFNAPTAAASTSPRWWPSDCQPVAARSRRQHRAGRIPRPRRAAVLRDVDALLASCRRRLPADAAPLQRLRLLNQFFFHELELRRQRQRLLRPRQQLPERRAAHAPRHPDLRWRCCRSSWPRSSACTRAACRFPGTSWSRCACRKGEVVIDPFTGHSLSREELDERLAPYRSAANGLIGEFDVPLGLFLQAAPPRDVLARMLRNLKEIHRSGRDWPRWLAVQDRLVILLPQAWDERRDRGLALGELGRFKAAVDDLEAYLGQSAGRRRCVGHVRAARRVASHAAAALTLHRLHEYQRRCGNPVEAPAFRMKQIPLPIGTGHGALRQLRARRQRRGGAAPADRWARRRAGLPVGALGQRQDAPAARTRAAAPGARRARRLVRRRRPAAVAHGARLQR